MPARGLAPGMRADGLVSPKDSRQPKWMAISCPHRRMSAPAAVFVAIIDDDEIQCRSLVRLVRRAGFHPLTFHSAEDFLLASERACFRCLLVDIQLSGISGLVLHQRLLAQGDRTPVIFITGHDDATARTEALNTGCAGYLRKTDPSGVIIELLRRVTSAP